MTSLSADLAVQHLSGVGTRLAHSATVARRAQHAGETLQLPDSWIERLASAGWLHDIGYAPQLADTGFHPLDGARWLQQHDVPQAVCSLVAWHTGSINEARLRGLDLALRAEHAEPPRSYLDVLTWADLTSAPDGHVCTVPERIDEILARYDDSTVVHQAVLMSRLTLEAAAARVRARLGSDR